MENSAWMQRMFDLASRRYVLSNKVITFGWDENWRKAAVGAIHPQGESKILDICTGTGDLALKIANKFPSLKIYALDYSLDMLAVAKERAMRQAITNITFKEGDCTHMEFDSGVFDYITVSFGFRNLSFSQDNLKAALKEIYRVLKKGGKFIIIETSQPQRGFIKSVFHFYASIIVPLVGMIFSGNKMPYAYLGKSITTFFTKDRLIEALELSGFKYKKAVSFLFGMILLSVAEK